MFVSLGYKVKVVVAFLFIFSLSACQGTSTDAGPQSDDGSISDANPTTPPQDTSGDNPVSNKSGAVTLNWLPPSDNTDGSTLTDLTGFKIYYGTSQDSMSEIITINNPSISTYVVENLSSNNTYFFTITTYNSKGIESVYSNVVSKYINI